MHYSCVCKVDNEQISFHRETIAKSTCVRWLFGGANRGNAGRVWYIQGAEELCHWWCEHMNKQFEREAYIVSIGASNGAKLKDCSRIFTVGRGLQMVTVTSLFR